MEIGDTVCNIFDSSDIGLIKGYITKLEYYNFVFGNTQLDRIKIILPDNKNSAETYLKYFDISKIVLVEKINYEL